MTEPASDTLAELATRIQRGDEAAFEQLFRQCHAPLCEVVDSYVRSQAIAEEIVQDLFFVLWMKRAAWPVSESTLGYLSTAARNRALHHLRRLSVVQRWADRVGDDAADVAMSQPFALPDQAAIASEEAAAVRRAIDQLPPRSRLAVVLRWDHGMSIAEVATMMGISVKGVEKLITGAKQRLRVSLRTD
ncbi:MAG: sigma-70 family RNA polymerase sigma factor [bacterium]